MFDITGSFIHIQLRFGELHLVQHRTDGQVFTFLVIVAFLTGGLCIADLTTKFVVVLLVVQLSLDALINGIRQFAFKLRQLVFEALCQFLQRSEFGFLNTIDYRLDTRRCFVVQTEQASVTIRQSGTYKGSEYGLGIDPVTQ
ncbi:hypothetical protein D3C87_1228080 [compost metagenome]